MTAVMTWLPLAHDLGAGGEDSDDSVMRLDFSGDMLVYSHSDGDLLVFYYQMADKVKQ